MTLDRGARMTAAPAPRTRFLVSGIATLAVLACGGLYVARGVLSPSAAGAPVSPAGVAVAVPPAVVTVPPHELAAGRTASALASAHPGSPRATGAAMATASAAAAASAASTAMAGAAPASATASAAVQVLALINQARAAAGLPALTVTPGLQASSAAHNQQMVGGCGLSHQCSGEASLGARETAAGVIWTAAGENIGDGGPVADTSAAIAQMAVGLTQSMLNEQPPDDGHRMNILSSTFTHIGIAVYRSGSGTVWLTQDFSNYRGSSRRWSWPSRREESQYRAGELRRVKRREVIARHPGEPSVRQQRGEVGRRGAAAVTVADHDQRGHRHLPQCLRGCRHERIEQGADRPRVGGGPGDPRGELRLLAARREGPPIGERGQQATVPVGAGGARVERVQPLAADERAGRPRAAGEQPQHQPAAERVAAQVVVLQAQVAEQREPVIGEHVGRVACRVVRSPAVPVAAQVRQDDPVAARGERPGRPALGEQRAVAEQPVQQDHRTTGASFAPRQLHAMTSRELVDRQFCHCSNFKRATRE